MSEYTEHKEIWLQPWCFECNACGGDRNWCQDNVWEEGCDCGEKAVKYVLAEEKKQK